MKFSYSFSMGLIRATSDRLTKRGNKDGKVSISGQGKNDISWLLMDCNMPPNFLAELDETGHDRILSPWFGAERIQELFRNVNNKIIPRSVVEQVAQQDDPIRRVRDRRHSLEPEGISIYCYRYDKEKFKEYGCSGYGPCDWLSIRNI